MSPADQEQLSFQADLERLQALVCVIMSGFRVHRSWRGDPFQYNSDICTVSAQLHQCLSLVSKPHNILYVTGNNQAFPKEVGTAALEMHQSD